jgi:hypothetical protein
VRLTTNTDFAETEVDERQVNLTRFPLFFPEKRDFFLEDAGVFEFGPGGTDLLPFFSRTIGRDDDGEAVPIVAGVKVTGKWGPWNVGVLDTLVEDDAEGDAQNIGVVRVSRNLGGESSAGVIVTSGDQGGDDEAATYGADFRVGSSRLFGPGQSGSLWGWALASRAAGGHERGAAYGLEARTQSSAWRNTLRARRIEEGFDPALGFVRRSGIDDYRVESMYTWRGPAGSALRQYDARVALNYEEDLVGREDTWSVPLRPLRVELWSEDSVQYEVHRIYELLDEGFEVGGGLEVEPGEYLMTRHKLELETNDRRLVKSGLELEWGDFFSGELMRYTFSPVVIPGKHFQFAVSYTDVGVALPEGDFDAQLVGVDLDWTFSPDLTWTNFFQYDTETEDLGVQSRVHWIRTPGQDLFVVALLGWDREERDSFRRTEQELAVKLTYTLRF